jgi:hypothetical protein
VLDVDLDLGDLRDSRDGHTRPMSFLAAETVDAGIDLGTPVAEVVGSERASGVLHTFQP